MKTYRLITTLLAIAVAAPTVMTAQEEQRERQRQAEAAARRQVELAREALEAAMRALEQSKTEETQEALRRAIEAAREAQRDMRTDEIRNLYSRIYLSSPERNFVVAGVTSRPRMGVILESSTGRSGTDSIGVVLQAVTPGGPAEEAGLKAGDIIVSANGTTLARVERRDDAPDDKLVAKIRELEDGETLSVVYRRGEETGTADVIVRVLEPANYSFSFSGDSAANYRFIERFAEPDANVLRMREPLELAFEPGAAWESVGGVLAWSFGHDWAQMELTTLDESLGDYFGTTEGLLVVRAPKSEDSQIRSGDVILRIGDRVPTSATHAMRIMRSYDAGETIHIEIMRNKTRQTIEVTVPERDRGFFWGERK